MSGRARRLFIVVGVVALASAVALWLGAHRDLQLALRLARIDSHIRGARYALSNCAPMNERCDCRLVEESRVFSRCSIIDGHVTLWIRSTDICFKQWIAVNSTWSEARPENSLGEFWISYPPSVIAPGWSLLAIAPCLD